MLLVCARVAVVNACIRTKLEGPLLVLPAFTGGFPVRPQTASLILNCDGSCKSSLTLVPTTVFSAWVMDADILPDIILHHPLVSLVSACFWVLRA